VTGPHLYRVRGAATWARTSALSLGIDEAQISLKELVQDSTGDWVERMSSLQLVEAKR
jgi:type IV pilus assembly protein PilP